MLCIYIYTYHDYCACIIYIYIYIGERLEVPSLGGWGGLRINVLWTALEERCCYVEDVAMLKMLLRTRCWRCLYVENVEDVAMLKMLLRWGCCYVEGVFTLKMLKMLLCWKKGMCISPVVLRGIMTFLLDPWRHWNSISTQFYWFLRKQHKVKNLKNLKLVKTADNIPRVEVVQCVIMFHEDHKTL